MDFIYYRVLTRKCNRLHRARARAQEECRPHISQSVNVHANEYDKEVDIE